MSTEAKWRALYYPGRERALLSIEERSILADSVIEWQNKQNQKHKTSYHIECSPDWRTRLIDIKQDGGKRQLSLSSDGEGRWYDAENVEIKKLSGCIDIDFQATPFTNTLPINRLNPEVGNKSIIKVVYITFPSLKFYPVEQYYTLLQQYTWLFEQPTDSFSAKIKVDDAGLVIDYPNLFQRIYS